MATDALEPQTAVGEVAKSSLQSEGSSANSPTHDSKDVTAEPAEEPAGNTETDAAVASGARREIKNDSLAGGAGPRRVTRSKGASTRASKKRENFRKSVSFDGKITDKVDKGRDKPISRTSNGLSTRNSQGGVRASVSKRANKLMKAKSERFLIDKEFEDPSSQSASRRSSRSGTQRRSRRLSTGHQSVATDNGSQATAPVPTTPTATQKRAKRLPIDHGSSSSQPTTTPQRKLRGLSFGQLEGTDSGTHATARRTKSASTTVKKPLGTGKSPRRALLKKSVSASFLIDANEDEGGEEVVQRRSVKGPTHRKSTSTARRSSSQRRRSKRPERVNSKGEPIGGTRRRSDDSETAFLAPLKDVAKEFVSTGPAVRSRRGLLSKMASERVLKKSELDNNLGIKFDNTARRNRNLVRNSQLPVVEGLENKLKRSAFLNLNEDANGENNQQQLMAAFCNRKELELGELLGEGATSMVHELKEVRLLREKNPNEESVLRKRFGLEILDKLSVSKKRTIRHEFKENVSSSSNLYALKHIKFSLLAEPEKFQAAIVSLATEAHYLGRLDHEKIVKIHALPTGGVSVLSGGRFDSFFIVMNRFDETLNNRITRWKGGYRLKENTLVNKLKIASQVAEGLDYLHSKRILHRDVKPASIGLVGDNLVQLFDFTLCRDLPPLDEGIALSNNQDGEVIYQMTVAGSSRYMAPEVKQWGNYNLKADVYSWAILCYEILSLNRAYNDISEEDLEDRVVVNGERPPVSESGLPLDVQELLSKAWEQTLERRMSITEVCEQLEHVLWILREPNKKILTVPQEDPDLESSFNLGDSYTKNLEIPLTKPTVKKVENFMESSLDASFGAINAFIAKESSIL